MEIVILDDMVATFNTTWVRLANTAGHDQIKPGDEFKENGALEEFSVEATSFSPVPGASRIRLLRAHHSTKAEVHKSGAVLSMQRADISEVFASYQVKMDAEHNGSVEAPVIATVEPDIPDTIVVGGTEYANPAKRGRGRPKGSPNKPKQPLVPAWPSV